MQTKPYIGLMGVRVSSVLEEMIRRDIKMRVENLTCIGGRRIVALPEEWEDIEEEQMVLAYAEALLGRCLVFG